MHADPKSTIKKTKIARGQIEGIIKMMENDEYCLDISNQILATLSLLRGVHSEILSAHLEHCVVNSSPETVKDKIAEINTLLKRIV